MFESKYSKVLTGILVVIVIAVIILLGFLGFDVYQKFVSKKASAQVLEEFDNNIKGENKVTSDENTQIEMVNEALVESNTTTGKKKVQYKGYNVLGKIEIPAINISYPVLERVTTKSIEIAVAVLYGPGLNEIGNTTIAGHNYRNGSFFGNNDKLTNGDKVYITDNSGNRIKYNIYNIYETTPDDGEYMERDTAGKREISLTTCTDNSKARLIIWAVEE